MRVAVSGSRGWADRTAIRRRLAKLPKDTVIVVGYNPEKKTPRGVDEIAYQEALKLGLPVECHPARWDDYRDRRPNPAGFIRNDEMADSGVELVLAFWDGRSHGTKHMIDTATRRGIEVEVIE